MPTGVYERTLKSPAERFWGKVDKRGPPHPQLGTACWLWKGALAGNGYGQIGLGRRGQGLAQAHRISWEIHNGAVASGLWVLHKCDNPTCVNPAHLFLGTHTDNMRDCARKGRNAQSRKTHCPRGHEYRADNLILRGAGRRGCRECQREKQRIHARQRYWKDPEASRAKLRQRRATETQRLWLVESGESA